MVGLPIIYVEESKLLTVVANPQCGVFCKSKTVMGTNGTITYQSSKERKGNTGRNTQTRTVSNSV